MKLQSLLISAALASCSSGVIDIPEAPPAECSSPEDCERTGEACRPFTCEQGSCVILVRNEGPCPYPDGGTGACVRGACE